MECVGASHHCVKHTVTDKTPMPIFFFYNLVGWSYLCTWIYSNEDRTIALIHSQESLVSLLERKKHTNVLYDS